MDQTELHDRELNDGELNDGEPHEIEVELAVVARGARAAETGPDGAAYLWVCGCGEGDEHLDRAEAVREARRHQRLAG